MDSPSFQTAGLPQPPPYRPDAFVSETDRRVKPPDQALCGCSADNTGNPICDNCACSKWGYACSENTCGCNAACGNPFNKLSSEAIFGAADPPIKMHPCFISFINKHRDLFTSSLKEPLSAAHVFHIINRLEKDRGLCGLEVYLEEDEEEMEKLAQWRREWEKSDADAEERLRLMQQLNRWAVGSEEERMGCFYSFCREEWEHKSHTAHCRKCGECMDWMEWHCGSCDKCTFGISISCQTCGGVSMSYHNVHTLKI